MSTLTENSFFQAIRKSLDTISTILSPFILLSVLSDFKEAIDFVSRHYLISILLLAFLLFLFVFHFISLLIGRRKNQKNLDQVENGISVSIIPKSPSKKSNNFLKRIVYVVGWLILILSIVTTITIFCLSIKGLYYPIISSVPKSNAQELVDVINNKLIEDGHNELTVRYYSKGGQNTCAIVPNGVHFSQESANESIKLAKQLIPQYVDEKGCWILSYTFKDTVIRKIQNIKSKLSNIF